MECDICGKKMPPNVLKAHKKKSHITNLKDTPPSWPGPVEFDFGEVQECGVCKEKWPSKLMKFHIKQEHGI